MEPDFVERVETMIDEPPTRAEVEHVLAEGYARALRLDADRLALERRITELAARAEDGGAAQELRLVWLHHRTLNAELRELRGLLRRLKDA